MNKSLTFFAFAIALLVGISQAAAQSMTMLPDRHETLWQANQKITFNYADDSISFNPEIRAGALWYFSHTFRAQEYLEVADDEYSEVFAWTMRPTNARRITLRDQQLVDANAYFLRACFCTDRGFHKVKSGTVTMLRQSNGWWRVSYNLVIASKEGAPDIKVSRTNVLFKLTP
jgi:hypothetical protein